MTHTCEDRQNLKTKNFPANKIATLSDGLGYERTQRFYEVEDSVLDTYKRRHLTLAGLQW